MAQYFKYLNQLLMLSGENFRGGVATFGEYLYLMALRLSTNIHLADFNSL